MNTNPFPTQDLDRHYIWDMLVSRDIRAFASQDWDMVAGDFVEENFMGVNAGLSSNPDDWKPEYPSLDAYKKAWLQQAKEFSEIKWAENIETALFRITKINDIDIAGDVALVHKKFAGDLIKADGTSTPAWWQTLYRCKKINGTWKITGFTGYMQNPGKNIANTLPAKQVPESAVQHTTAGPYSPVLVINPASLVVISGQAAIDMQGNIIGDTIEEQAAYTLDNCSNQLAYAGCTLDDVFKVNVYMKDLADWPRFNEVYKNYFNEPRPVRTAVQTGLLMTLLVEIEMWAAKS